MKRQDKEEIRKQSLTELHKRLEDLQKDKLKLESNMLTKNGSSMKVRNYPNQPQTAKFGNLKQLHKQIAYVKQVIHLRTIR